MSQPPPFEERRQRKFEAELLSRARLWLPEWQPRDDDGDFLTALFRIAARFSSEVAQRLDRMPEKNFLGFLHWLGIRGEAARAARVPVVFTMTAGADPIAAIPPVQFQAATDPPVPFETTTPFTVTPSALIAIVAADTGSDFYAESPSEVLSLDAPDASPSEWRVASEVQAGSVVLQLEPAVGLEAGVTIQDSGNPPLQYTIVKKEDVLVQIEPALGLLPMGHRDRVSTLGA